MSVITHSPATPKCPQPFFSSMITYCLDGSVLNVDLKVHVGNHRSIMRCASELLKHHNINVPRWSSQQLILRTVGGTPLVLAMILEGWKTLVKPWTPGVLRSAPQDLE